MRFLSIIFSLLFFLLFLSSPVNAQEKESHPVITIINPIRGNELGLEKTDLLSSLQAQWKVTSEAGLSATWLWQYSALENEQLVDFAKKDMKGQEFGIFLEIDRNLAQKSGVQYRGQGPWYFSDGLFLVSYDIGERRKLIDGLFSSFKKKFGYYPKTVGAWWIGADSLTYMQQKYGIVAAVKATDQADMDVYSILGTPWNIPYIASQQNEGIPASNDNSSHVVILQWAPRDPIDGYKDARYSMQDFTLVGYDFSYVDYLFSLFLNKPLDNLVIGLENGSNLAGYEKGYSQYLQKAATLKKSGKIDILTASDYAESFLAQKSTFSENHYFLTKGFKSDNESFWYNSENFRAAIHKVGNTIYLVDLRDYSQKNKEDFSLLPNSQGYLRISTPSYIDSIRMPDEKLFIASNAGRLNVNKQGDTVTLLSGTKKIASFTDLSVTLFLDNNTKQTFTFHKKPLFINVFAILLGIFFLYFIFIFLQTKNLKRSILQLYLLLIPLFIAYSFLSSGIMENMPILFDRKQLWLLSVFPALSSLSLTYTLLIYQTLPLITLLIIHYICVMRSTGKWQRGLFYGFFVGLLMFYMHVPYFPLNKSTYLAIALSFLVITVLFIVASILIFKRSRSKKVLFLSLISIPIVLAVLTYTVYVSRSRIILTPFEVNALQVIKEKKKDVIFISQTNYNIKPIYKAVKPLLYEDYRYGARLTGTKWTIVEKTEGGVVDLSRYDDKFIVLPRYLGADFSEKEIEKNNIKKIFDNGQIAIFIKQ